MNPTPSTFQDEGLGVIFMPTKKHPHPLDAKQPTGEGNTPGTTGRRTGQGTTGAQGHSMG